MSYWDYDTVDFSDIIGKKIADVQRSSDEIEFITECGERYKMYHSQDCCENVYIDAIDGNLDGLIGGVVRDANVSTNDGSSGGNEVLWTYYRIRTENEFCHITWRGSSNGYYSVSVKFVRYNKEDYGNA